MKTTIILILFFLIFSCKNQPNNKKSLSNQPKIESSDKKKLETFFDLIVNKKETHQNLPNKIDIFRKYSEKEIRELNIDTTKPRETVYYELIDEKFLKSKLENFKLMTYYTSEYMSSLLKILRIECKDSIRNLNLSARYGNGLDSYTMSSEFINDSIFIKTRINNWCIKDEQYLMAYDIDSIITKYKYNQNLNFKLIKKDTFSILKEILTNKLSKKKQTKIEHLKLLGRIKKHKIVYGISYTDYSVNLPEYLVFYIKGSNKKLFKLNTNGAYIGKIELFNINDSYFIYVRMDETSGIQYGVFYSIDVINKKAKKVIDDFGNYKIPDSLEIYRGSGINKTSNNEFFSILSLSSKKNGKRYHLRRTHKLVKNKNNLFVLKVVKNEI